MSLCRVPLYHEYTHTLCVPYRLHLYSASLWKHCIVGFPRSGLITRATMTFDFDWIVWDPNHHVCIFMYIDAFAFFLLDRLVFKMASLRPTVGLCGIIHSHVRHVSFTCVTWLIPVCDMTLSYVWHDSFIHVKWFILCVTYFIHMCNIALRTLRARRNTCFCFKQKKPEGEGAPAPEKPSLSYFH